MRYQGSLILFKLGNVHALAAKYSAFGDLQVTLMFPAMTGSASQPVGFPQPVAAVLSPPGSFQSLRVSGEIRKDCPYGTNMWYMLVYNHEVTL